MTGRHNTISTDSNGAKKKIFAVASFGGHWIELLQIARGLEPFYDIIYCTTNDKCAQMIPGHELHSISDFSRSNMWRIPKSLSKLMGMMMRIQPEAVITTGAAPGLMAIIAAKLCGIKTIWVDSVANAEHLSGSGKVARYIANHVYTQWPDIADGKSIIYKGSIFG